MRLHCEHRIPLDVEAFWALIHSDVYEARCAEALELTEYTVLERREEPRCIYRRIRVAPPVSPSLAALLRRVSDGALVSYVEEQWRSRDERTVRFQMTPSFLADRARIEGEVRVVPAGARACRRILEGEVEIRAFGIGGLLERAIVAQTVESYAKTAALAAEVAGAGPRK